MASSVIGALRVVLGMNAGEFSSDAKRAGRSMDRLADKAKKAGAAIGAAFAVGQLKSFAQESVRLFGVQEDAIASVEAALKTTGGTAGFTSKKLQEMASALQEVTTFGDEDILRGATSNLLTFGNIVGPVFERAQKAALDLSQQFNVGLKESSIQLGKALNDPIQGISALSRVGIAFTQQQKDQIKTLVESGKVMEAQGVILDEIEKFYGQAAEAAAKTTAGQMTQAANAFGDAMEMIGQSIAPVVVPAAKAIKDLSVAFAGLSPETRSFIVVAGGVTVAVGAVAATVGILVSALGAVAAPIAGAVAALGVLSGAVAANWRGITNLANSIGESFKGIYDSARKWLVDALEPVVSRVQGVIDRIRNTFQSLRKALGLEETGAAVKAQLAVVTDEVDGAVTKLSEIWNRGAEEGEALAEEVAPKMVMPMIVTADQARAAAKVVDEESKRILAAQQELINEGVRLTEDLKTPYDIMREKVTALTAAQEAGKITAEQLGEAQQRAAYVAQNAYASMASSIVGSLEDAFGQSKAVAIAQALINTYQSFTNAMANIPAPFNIPAAAAALASGLAQVANIRKTNKSGGGGGSGSVASGAGAAAGAGGGQAQAGVQQSLVVQGISADQIFSGDAVRGLAQQLLDYQRDGGKVVLV